MNVIRIIECGTDTDGDDLYFDPINQICTKSYQCPNIGHSDLVDICTSIGRGVRSLVSDLTCKR